MSDDLVTQIIADGAPFAKGCDEVRASAHELEHDLKHFALEVGSIFVGGLGVEKFAESMKEQIEKVTELSHLSERTGIDINELRALQYEAKRSGVEFETLQNSIKKMQVNLGDAAGGGKKRAVFEQLGLDPDQLADMDPAQAFAKIGDGIKSIENPTSRVHYAFEALGKMGAETLGVLLKGTEGLKQAQGKVGLLDPQDVEEMHRAHDAMLDLDAAGQKISRTFATDLAPAISLVAEKLANEVQWVDHLVGQMKDPDIRHLLFGEGTPEQEAADDKAHAKKMFGGQDLVYDMSDVEGVRDRLREKQAKEANEKARRIEEENGKLTEKYAKEALQQAKEIAQQANAHRREFESPEDKYSRKQDELYGLEEALDPEELDQGLQKAADDFNEKMSKDFDKEMDEWQHEMSQAAEEVKRLLEASDPGKKLEDALRKAKSLAAELGLSKGDQDKLEGKAIDEFTKAKMAEMGPIGEEHHERIRGPEISEFGTAAYSDFFKNTRPDTDQEEKKQTEYLRRSVDIQNDANAILQKIASQTGTPQTGTVKIAP